MPIIKDENLRTNLVNKLSSYLPSPVQMMNGAWYVFKIGSIAGGVVAVQSPINTLALRYMLMAKGVALPPILGPNFGMLPVARALYKGTNVSGAALRTTYMETAQKASAGKEREMVGVQKIENAQEASDERQGSQSQESFRQGAYMLGFAAGDVAITQISDTRSRLIKAHVIEPTFPSKGNYVKFATKGVVVRYGASIINLSVYCFLTDAIAQKMPFESNEMKKALSGVLSGMVAAVATLPLTFWRDYALATTKNDAGVLTMPNTLELMSSMHQYAKQVGVFQASRELSRKMMIQAPFRMAQVGAVFGVMALIQEVIPDKPPESLTKLLEDFSKKQSTSPTKTGPFAGLPVEIPLFDPESILAAPHVPPAVARQVIQSSILPKMMKHGLFGSEAREALKEERFSSTAPKEKTAPVVSPKP